MLRVLSGGRLFAEQYGETPPRVVALHGWARSRADFDEVLKGFDALALDLPGFGVSPEPPAAWGSADYAELVAGALREIEGDRYVLLGHSFGGRVAVRLAAQHPDLVAGLVLTGVPLLRRSSGSRPATAYRIARRLHAIGLLGDARMERLRQRYGSADYRAAQGVMRDVLVRAVNESYEKDLAALSCPVEMVWGATDTAATVAVAEEAAGLTARAHLTVLPEVGHLTPLSAPAALRDALHRQLDGAARG